MRFGAFEILHELKSGGMGSVLLGRRRGPGTFEQLVAIKTIRREHAATEAVRAMFLDEAKILASITHPGIATVHDFGEQDGLLYMAMEYVAGISFRAFGDHVLPPGVAARAIAEACRGLHAAHEARDAAGHLLGVVHRDISPDNLMLGYDGHVKVIDFGIALVKKNRQAPVTEFGTVKGKPPYMSPEQVKNEAMDRRSDVFSLAVVLYELLTDQPLFDGESIYAVARAVEHQVIRPPSQVRGAALPAGLDAAVMAALDRDLARRTPTAAAFAEQLEQAIAQSGDETVEAWADRELAQPRAAHRSWIASVVAGVDGTTPMGRATGAVTALGPLALSPPRVETPPAPSVLREVSSETEIAHRRRLGVPLVLALLGLLAAGVAMFFATRPSTRAAVAMIDAAAARDAPPDAGAEIDATTIEAAVPIDAAADARASDARMAGHDARTAQPIDAIRTAQVDAKPDAPVVTGTGAITVRHHPSSPSYLEIRIDGVPFGKTPIVKPKSIAAGRHLLVLVMPSSDEIVYRQTIEIRDGETLDVVQSAP